MKSLRQALGDKIEVNNPIPQTEAQTQPKPQSETKTKSRSAKQFMKSMLSDSHDDTAISSKRVITLLAFIFCTIAFFANLFFGYEIDEFIFNTMAYIVLGGFGVTGLEKFANHNVTITQEEQTKNRWE